VTAELVDDAHRRGIRVVPYTVDEPATMATFVDLGVDGFITPTGRAGCWPRWGVQLPLPVPLRGDSTTVPL
jgi:glycerophosphoryl diester phosphodiesterase